MSAQQLVIGRCWCPICRRVALVVREPDAEVRCPRCESEAVPCSGVAGWQDRQVGE